MSSLFELLAKVSALPAEEMKPGMSMEDRPNEMLVLGQIISVEEIAEFKVNRGVKISRACLHRDRLAVNPEIHLRVLNGKVTDFVVKRVGEVAEVTVNGKVASITTVQELTERIMALAKEPED